ncbi:MAG: aspartate aminotransferase family protein [Chlorobi bacterium]|nr:aspartate aminotransferase family protein [Chlorobiota bacterium]
MDFVMGRREGPYLWDIDGEKRLINLHCNGGVFNLGHRNPVLIKTLTEALETYDIGNHHLMSKTRAVLAERLAQSMPGDLEYVVFGVGGGEAVDLAFKVARGFTHKTKIISALGGYHGHTGLAIAAGDPKYRDPFGLSIPGFVQVPFADIEAMKTAFDKDTAAVILETIPATLGMPVPEKAYLQQVATLCKENNVLLIMDEVQSGLGRTGKVWAFEHFGIVPDIVVIGKGLSGGLYPITVTVLRKDIESVFHEDPFIHISTFGGAEPGCIVAGKVLEITSDPDFLSRVNRLAALFHEGVDNLQKRRPRFVKGLRQMGLMMGLELQDEISGPLLTKTAYDNGLLMVYANNDTSVCQLLPPLNLPVELMDEIMEKLDKAVVSAIKLKPLLKMKRTFNKLF